MNDPIATMIFPNLWLGNFHAAMNESFLKKNKIQYVVNITTDIPCVYPWIVYRQWMVNDDNICTYQNEEVVSIIGQLVDFIHHGVSHGIGVLVHCKQGHHRSAGIVMAYLMKYKCMCFNHSRLYIKNKRPLALRRNSCMIQWVYTYYIRLYFT